MPDPLDVLRSPAPPIAPDPAFATRLRARLARALSPDPEGEPMTTTTTHTYQIRHGDLAYVSLGVGDAERAAAFYRSVLGWAYEPVSRPESRRVVGQSLAHGIWAGGTDRSLFLCIGVDDLADAVGRVRAQGGTATDPHEEAHGWIADCTDDQGMPFALYQTTPGAERGPVNGERPGDVSYVTIEVVDAARFRRFFGEVVGWRFTPGRVEDGWGVEDTVPMIGIHGGHDVVAGVPMYRVDDVAAAVARVRAAGGTATDPERQPYGVSAECVDDQGTRFYLGET